MCFLQTENFANEPGDQTPWTDVDNEEYNETWVWQLHLGSSFCKSHEILQWHQPSTKHVLWQELVHKHKKSTSRRQSRHSHILLFTGTLLLTNKGRTLTKHHICAADCFMFYFQSMLVTFDGLLLFSTSVAFIVSFRKWRYLSFLIIQSKGSSCNSAFK